MSDSKYVIGIDLGTTNSVVAYVNAKIDETDESASQIRIFNIPQLTGPGVIEEQEMLPSSILLPGSHDVPEGALSVAMGAAYYGLSRKGQGIRIRGGLPMTYYIGIEAAMPAVPGIPTPVKALCVAPFGMEEGIETSLPEKEFGLVTGEPVKFDFLGSHTRRHDTIGAVIEDWAGEIEKITTLETNLEGPASALLPVTLRIHATEVGTLEIWCDSKEDNMTFKLEFNVREKNPENA